MPSGRYSTSISATRFGRKPEVWEELEAWDELLSYSSKDSGKGHDGKYLSVGLRHDGDERRLVEPNQGWCNHNGAN